jgi:four helix bundle protein
MHSDTSEVARLSAVGFWRRRSAIGLGFRLFGERAHGSRLTRESKGPDLRSTGNAVRAEVSQYRRHQEAAMGDYKKLRVWQQACVFADDVERLVMTLPAQQRRYALDQLVPAAHAIHENLAEGCGFDSDRQLLKYARQALSTANESEDELLALDRKNLLGNSVSLPEGARSLCRQLAKLIRRLEIDVARQGARIRPAHTRRPAPADQPEAKRTAESRKPRAESRSRKPKAEGPVSRRPRPIADSRRQEPRADSRAKADGHA